MKFRSYATDLMWVQLNGQKSAFILKERLKEAPPDVVNKYFVNDGSYFQVKDEIKRYRHF